MAYNKIILMGNLCKDPEFKQTTSGTAVVYIDIAVQRKFANKQSGERETDFLRCQAWGSTAEFINKYFEKGRPILIDGELRNNNYTDQSGTKHYSNIVLIDNVSFCGQSGTSQQRQTQTQASTPTMSDVNLEEFEELNGVPF